MLWIELTAIAQEFYYPIEQILKAKSHKTVAVPPPTTHLENPLKLDEQDMQDTVGEVRTNTQNDVLRWDPFTRTKKGWATS